MARKRRNEISGEPKKPTRYADRKPHWLRELLEEGRGPEWQPPRHVRLEFSEKDPEKEAYRNEIIQRKRERAASRR